MRRLISKLFVRAVRHQFLDKQTPHNLFLSQRDGLPYLGEGAKEGNFEGTGEGSFGYLYRFDVVHFFSDRQIAGFNDKCSLEQCAKQGRTLWP